MTGYADKLTEFVMGHRAAVLLGAAVVCLVFACAIPGMENQILLQDLLPAEHPYIQLHERFSRFFGGAGSAVGIVVKERQGDIFNYPTLDTIKRITDEVALWDEAYRSLTHSIASGSAKVIKSLPGGELHIEALMSPAPPQDQQGLERLKKNISENPAYAGVLVSRDAGAAFIMTETKDGAGVDTVYKKLDDIVARYTDSSTSVHLAGYPVLMGWLYKAQGSMLEAFAVSLALMAGLLAWMSGSFLVTLPPLCMLFVCTALGLGFIGLTGINFSPLLYVLAFLVTARVLSNAVQITHRFREELLKQPDRQAAAAATLRAMLMPNAAAVITDVAGFLVLACARIALMRHIALVMGFWMSTVALEAVLVPLVCSVLPWKTGQAGGSPQDRGRLPGLCVRLVRFSLGRGAWLIGAAAAVLLAAGAWLAASITVGDASPGSSLFSPGHRFNRDQALVNRLFNASADNFILYYQGRPESVYDPAVLQTFEQFDRFMSLSLPDRYRSSSSVIDTAKMLNCLLHEGDPIHYQLPRGEAQLTGLLGCLRSTAGTAVLRRFIDAGLERSQITLYFSDHTSATVNRILAAAEAFFSQHPRTTAQGEFFFGGGRIGMEAALNHEMKLSHAGMNLLVLGAIFLACAALFRSFVAGAMLTAPLLLANCIAFGYMAGAGIGLSIHSLPCAAIAAGVGVDFAIFLYSRCREQLKQGQGWHEAIMAASRSTGCGIVQAGLIIMLPVMAWYWISDLQFQSQMGLFLALMIGGNMLAALTLHPLLISIVKPDFLLAGSGVRQECMPAQ